MDKNKRNKNLFFSLVLFSFSPVISAAIAVRNFRLSSSRWILVLFFGVFGMTMIIQDGKDAKVHSNSFTRSYLDKEFNTFIDETKNILLLKPNENENTNDDIYLHFISFLVGKVSSNPAFLFFIVSSIYGFFYIRGISIVFDSIEGKRNLVLFIIFFLFVFWKSLEGINSIRNWTAGWVFFNGVLSFFQTKNKKYILLILSSPLIHFAYGAIIIPFFLILVFGNRPKIFFLILILSFIFSVENIGLIVDYLNMTDLGSEKTAYVNDEYSEYFIEGAGQAFHSKYYLAAGKLVISSLFYYAIVFFGYLKKRDHNYLFMSLASMGILMVAFSNIVSFSEVLNKRVFTNGGLYILAYLVLVYSKKLNDNDYRIFNFNIIVYLCTPLILFFTFTQSSHIGDFTDAKIFVSPIFYIFFEGDYSLKQLLRVLID